MKPIRLPLHAGVLLALLLPAHASALEALIAPPSIDGLQVRHETAQNGVAFDARWTSDWGRVHARTATLREPDGRIVSTTRASWQTDLPEVASSLRLGSQQAAATIARNAFDLTGIGLAGRLVPVLADYALIVGRQDLPGLVPLDEERTSVAMVRRALGGGMLLGLHAMRQGALTEVGAMLDGMRIGQWRQRLGLLQTRGEAGEQQQRLIVSQQLRLGGITLNGRAEHVLDDCAAPLLLHVPMPPTLPPPIAGGCSAWRGDANFPLEGRWRLHIGSGVKRDGEDAMSRQISLGTTWQAPRGAQFRLAVQRDASNTARQQRVDATLAWSYGARPTKPPVMR